MSENIKIEAISATECKVSIEIPAAFVDRKFDEFFEGIRGKAQVPGFRAGKAPLKVLKQQLTEKARPAIVNLLLGECYERLVKEDNISPIGNPNIKDFDPKFSEFPGRFSFDGSYSVEMTVEVLPKVDAAGYIGLDIQMPTDIDETKMYDDKMNQYREQFAERKQITDRGAALGDSCVIDFTGFIDGNKFEGGSAEAVPLNKLGASNFIPGFEEQLIGMKPEENKKIVVKFPENYHAKHLANKDAAFDVTMHSIVESKLCDISPELAMMAGFNSLDEMAVNIKQAVSGEKKTLVRQKLENQVVEKLLAVNQFDVPKSMISDEITNIMKRVKDAATIPEQLKEQIKKMAEFNVKKAIILDAVYDKEKSIEISPEELNVALEEHAKGSNKTKDELISLLYNSNQMDNFVGVLKTAKVVDFVIDNAKKGN